MDATTLEQLIRQEIPDAVIDVRDVRGDGLYFDATVVSSQFADMTRIQQHRRVHRALDAVIGNDLPALKLTTRQEK